MHCNIDFARSKALGTVLLSEKRYIKSCWFEPVFSLCVLWLGRNKQENRESIKVLVINKPAAGRSMQNEDEICMPVTAMEPRMAAVESATDEGLLERFWRHHDEAALSELVRRYQDMAYRVAFARCGRKDLAEESAQDAFVELVRKTGQPVPHNFKHWFLAVVQNQARRRMRAERRITQRQQSERYQEEATALSKQRHSEHACDSETREALTKALGWLQEELRLPLFLYYVTGLSQDEVSRQVGISQPMVARRISRGLDALRTRLSAQGFAVSLSALPALLRDPGLLPAPASLSQGLAVDLLQQLARQGVAESMRRGPLVAGWNAAWTVAACVLLAATGGLAYWLAGGSELPAKAPPAQQARATKWTWDFTSALPEDIQVAGDIAWRKPAGGKSGGLCMGYDQKVGLPGAILLPRFPAGTPKKCTLNFVPEVAGRYSLRGEWINGGGNVPMRIWYFETDYEHKMKLDQSVSWVFYILDNSFFYESRLGKPHTICMVDSLPETARMALVLNNILLTSVEIVEIEENQIPAAMREACASVVAQRPPDHIRKAENVEWSDPVRIPHIVGGKTP